MCKVGGGADNKSGDVAHLGNAVCWLLRVTQLPLQENDNKRQQATNARTTQTDAMTIGRLQVGYVVSNGLEHRRAQRSSPGIHLPLHP